MVYEKIIRPMLFKMDPEFVHDRFTSIGSALGSNPITRTAVSCVYKYENPVLTQTIDGITFKNPVGLAAGFDKDCRLLKIMPSMSFGFEEVGSITYEPYCGNPKPRLVRLPKDKAIIVYYGLKNKGAKELKQKFVKDGKRVEYDFPIGISIAKTNKKFNTQKEKIADWISGIKIMNNCSDYITINLSCPNTFDLQNFCEPDFVETLLNAIDKSRIKFKVPVYLKLSADISIQTLDGIIAVAQKHPFVRGFILSNLVKDRSSIKLKSRKSEYMPYKGGISGPVVKAKSIKLVAHAYNKTRGKYTIIACGGIFTADDAYEYIRSGASLLQMITGMVYGGPASIKRINKGLAKRLEEDGYDNISQAIGADFKKPNGRRYIRKKRNI